MPATVTLSVKNVPTAVAKRLKERAARNNRSLQGELQSILEQAAHVTTLGDLAALAKRLRSRAEAAGTSRLAHSISRIGHLTTRTGIVVLVTDCYEQPEALGRAVAALRMGGHDVIVFHLVDPAEKQLPGDMPATFEDAESGALLPLRPGELRDKYTALITAHHAALQERFTSAGADYVRLDTSEPLDRALHAYLDARLSRSRVR